MHRYLLHIHLSLRFEVDAVVPAVGHETCKLMTSEFNYISRFSWVYIKCSVNTFGCKYMFMLYVEEKLCICLPNKICVTCLLFLSVTIIVDPPPMLSYFFMNDVLYFQSCAFWMFVLSVCNLFFEENT